MYNKPMNTPIYDFVQEYKTKRCIRAHMPGHKGLGPLGIEDLDITEIAGADELYAADGIIAESERNAGSIFGAHTFYSTEGSSLAIRAMVYLAYKYACVNSRYERCSERNSEHDSAHDLEHESEGAACRPSEKPWILAGRNAHKTFLNTVALLDIPVEWIYGEEGDSYESCTIDAYRLRQLLAYNSKNLPCAVYLTTPDYLGQLLDLEALAWVCHEYGVLLLIDNAHGAYLKFLTPSRHPMDLGADLCADSAHKTLPVLTGGAYLQISLAADPFFAENAREAMELFGSTSPSYLILESLDLANLYMESLPEKMQDFVQSVANLKNSLSENGYKVTGDEPWKVTINPPAYGYHGEELADLVRAAGLEPEYCDDRHLVLMLTPQNSREDLDGILRIFRAIPRREPVEVEEEYRLTERPRQAMPMHAALFAETEELPAEECQGRILASAAVSCPPAVPLYMYGEEMGEKLPKGRKLRVVKNCSAKND